MKRFLLLSLMLTVVVAMQASDDTLSAYIDDHDSITNIRNAPGGRVVITVTNNVAHEVMLKNPTNGWWEVVEIFNAENEEDTTEYLTGSDTGRYWIHSSVVGFDTRNYDPSDKLPLRAKPSSKARVAHSIRGTHHVSPLDVRGDWVKIKTEDGHVGWVQMVWICWNPLTTCP